MPGNPEKQKLPPDPDGQNDDRAAWAEQAIVVFEKCTRAERATSLSDLLHWADRNGGEFEKDLEWARSHYQEETYS